MKKLMIFFSSDELFLKGMETDPGLMISPNPTDFEKVKTENGSEKSMETGSSSGTSTSSLQSEGRPTICLCLFHEEATESAASLNFFVEAVILQFLTCSFMQAFHLFPK